jgi:hypothetical protein
MRSSIIFLDSAVTTIRSGLTARSGWIDRHPTASSARFLPFSSYGLVFFVCAFDAVFELAPVVEKLLDHFVAAGNIATDRSKVDNLTDVEFVRGLAAQVRPPSAFILARLCDTQGGAPRFEPETPLTSCTSVILDSSLQFLLGLAPEDRLRDLQRRFRALSAR